MTLPYERKRAVTYTEKFLIDLCNPAATPRVPKDVRDRARALLRHYPSKYEMDVAAEKAPNIFGEDTFNRQAALFKPPVTADEG